MSKASKNVTYGQELHDHIAIGVEKVYEVAISAYGPNAGNAMLELPYGDPLISRDGVTNVEKVFLEQPIENMAARTIIQASRKNNRKVGDGTTAVVILAKWLYTEARKMLSAGYNQMEVSRMLENTSREVVKLIDEMKLPVTEDLLRHVAIVSAGDPAIGAMIADVIGEVGLDGGVTVEDFAGIGIYNELVDGFYFRRGFTNVNLISDPTNLESRHTDADILICEKKIMVPSDIEGVLEKIVVAAGRGKELILIGDVSDDVLNGLILNKKYGVINVTVADLPIFGPLRSLALEDLALVTGGKVYSQGSSAEDFDVEMLGGAKRVIINEFSTTIIDGDGEQEPVETRVEELRKQLREADSPGTVEALKERLARLTGKVAIVRVGGATEIEQGEVKLRVQDAICAVQAAIKDGVVPGGGVTLARISYLLEKPRITSLVPTQLASSFAQPFICLVENAGLNTERALMNLQTKPKTNWHGYDLRKPVVDYKLTDLLEAGIIDPASVVKEVVQNATSVVSKLITVSVGVTYVDREQKHD